MNRSIRRNTAKFLALLLRGDYSLQEIADKAGMNYETVRPFVRELHDQGVVHISGWRRDSKGRQVIALWQLGTGLDAPKQAPQPGVARTRKHLARKDAPLAVRGVRIADRSLERAFGVAP